MRIWGCSAIQCMQHNFLVWFVLLIEVEVWIEFFCAEDQFQLLHEFLCMPCKLGQPSDWQGHQSEIRGRLHAKSLVAVATSQHRESSLALLSGSDACLMATIRTSRNANKEGRIGFSDRAILCPELDGIQSHNRGILPRWSQLNLERPVDVDSN